MYSCLWKDLSVILSKNKGWPSDKKFQKKCEKVDSNQKILSDVANISTGRSFRGGVSEINDGQYHVLQLKNVVSTDTGYGISTENLVRTNIEMKNKRPIPLLNDGDIVVMAKGSDFTAHRLVNVPANTVGTQHFISIASQNEELVLDDFLYFYLSLSSTQQWLSTHGGGTYQKTISVATLSKLPFPVVSIEKQQQLLAIAKDTAKEKQIMLELIENRQQQIEAIIREYI